MVHVNQPLTSEQADRFRVAQNLLSTGNHVQAVQIARALAKQAPSAADAHQLLGMALADAGDHGGARSAFRTALQLAPRSAVVAANFARWLRKCGHLEEAMAVLEASPESPEVHCQIGTTALSLKDNERARRAFERALRLQPDAVRAWQGLGHALRGMRELESAEIACRKVTELSPDQAPGWINLAVVLRLLGRVDEALACLHHAERIRDEPALQDLINGVLHDAGRAGEALVRARSLVAAHPEYAQGYETLANLLWENGPDLAPDEDPLKIYRAAANATNSGRDLQLGFARMLLSARRADEALEILQRVRRGREGDPMIDWYLAEALAALGENPHAERFYASAHRHLATSPEFLNAYARHSFRTGRPDRASACATRTLQLDPENQEAWSHLGIAWRLAGDTREQWLFDYDRLIGYVEVVPPPEFDGVVGFLACLERALHTMHVDRREPVSQSVRNGSQTAGRLFGRKDPSIRAAQETLKMTAEAWLDTLPHDPDHPFLSRKRGGVRFVGSWSVLLRSSGRHSSHIHTEGWMSSAFYVALPATIITGASEETHAGWIQFGQPLEDFGLDLAPRRLIQPRPGYLALFPSYMWHGTIPFTDTDPRLTIAADMQPI